MDLAILIVLLAVVIFFFKRFDSFIYFVAIVDIFLRILGFVKAHVPVPELQALIGRYFPESIPAIIGKYTNGIVNTIFIWIYAIIFMIFLFYTARIFFRKK
mgnify:CR=1 FL=1